MKKSSSELKAMDYRQLTNMQQSTYYMHEPEQESEMVFEIPTYNPSSGGDRNYIDYSQNSFLDISKNWKQNPWLSLRFHRAMFRFMLEISLSPH